jgi:site-specific DNA-methyltransferase (adenine-specific)
MKKQVVINGDNVELLKKYPDNYFDSVVTDPPYGLGKEPNANDMLKAWLDNGYLEVMGSGFMGKEWDSFVPQPIFWKEVFRVLKHGGHVVAFYGTRTYDWGVMAMRLSGFEIRDCIQWIYGSGFPKSFNVSKGIEGKLTIGSSNTNAFKNLKGDKKVVKNGYTKMQFENGIRPSNYNDTTSGNYVENVNYTSEEAKKWKGWGSALKPANEPIVLARKPLEKGLSIAENVMKYGTGAINIDASRIGNELIKGQKAGQGFNNVKGFGVNTKIGDESAKEYISEAINGRFPANVLLTHHPDCKCIGIKKVGSGKEGGYNYEGNVYDVEGFVPKNSPNANSNYGEEIVEDWDCHDDCPIKILDEQSGIDSGGASRFFYVAKTSQWERNYGLEGFEEKQIFGDEGETFVGLSNSKKPSKNVHPTIKPIKLMQYLVRMITPPNGIVLDPFCGSGTTGIACKIDDFEFVGLELNEEYVQIAQTRIESFDAEKVFIDETKIYEMRTKKEDDENDYGSTQLNLFD